MRRVWAVLVAGLLAFGLGVSPAAADGYNSCSWGSIPASAAIHVREYPGPGDVQYVDVDSTVQIDTAASTDKPYYDGGTRLLATGHFDPHPIDGDGFWNYRDTWNYNSSGTDYSRVSKVVVYLKLYGSQSSCTRTTPLE